MIIRRREEEKGNKNGVILGFVTVGFIQALPYSFSVLRTFVQSLFGLFFFVSLPMNFLTGGAGQKLLKHADSA